MLTNDTKMLQMTAQMSPFLNTQLQQWTLSSPYKFQVKFFPWISYFYRNLWSIKIWSQILTWDFYTDRYFVTIQTSSHIFDLISICWNMWTNVTKCWSKMLPQCPQCLQMSHLLLPKCRIPLHCNDNKCY
jgi:hypothetical protein